MPGMVKMTCEECGFGMEFPLKRLNTIKRIEERAENGRGVYEGGGYKWACANCEHVEEAIIGIGGGTEELYTNALVALGWAKLGVPLGGKLITPEEVEEIRLNERAKGEM